MKTTNTGGKAEAAVCEKLKQQGYKILGQNWKTRLCEIDVIVQKDKTVFFVEVKYRSQDGQGTGLEYITATKLKQMNFAAENWLAQSSWGGDARLMAAEVSGANCEQIELVEV